MTYLPALRKNGTPYPKDDFLTVASEQYDKANTETEARRATVEAGKNAGQIQGGVEPQKQIAA
jgi:hypothetical protein